MSNSDCKNEGSACLSACFARIVHHAYVNTYERGIIQNESCLQGMLCEALPIVAVLTLVGRLESCVAPVNRRDKNGI